MKKNNIIIAILILCSAISGQQVALLKNQLIKKHTYSSKISPLLAMQLDLKLSHIAAPQKYSLRNFISRDMKISTPELQKVYLYFKDFDPISIVLPDGEQYKNLDTLNQIREEVKELCLRFPLYANRLV